MDSFFHAILSILKSQQNLFTVLTACVFPIGAAYYKTTDVTEGGLTA